MSKHAELYLTLLKNAGYRITEQRRLICDYLAQTDKHPTPYEVYAELAEQHPEISRATVYNTLNTLQSLGGIVELNFGANHTHYDTDPMPHINLICLRCHAVEDYHPVAKSGQPTVADLPQQCFMTLATDQALQAAIAQLDFQPLATKLDILGLCHRCRQATPQEN